MATRNRQRVLGRQDTASAASCRRALAAQTTVICAPGNLFEAAADPTRPLPSLSAVADPMAAAMGRPLEESELNWVAALHADAENYKTAVQRACATCATVAAALDAARVGLVVLDPRGQIIDVNTTAAQLWSDAPSEFLDAIVRARRALRSVPTPNGPTAFQTYLGDGHTLEFSRAPGAACSGPLDEPSDDMLLVTSTKASAAGAAVIAQALELTAAEGRLCEALAAGLSVAEAANALGIRVTTARSHLRSVFSKTQTRRQADLMALLASMPAGVDTLV